MARLRTALATLSFVLPTLPGHAGPPGHFDELRDENGNARAGYAEIIDQYDRMSEKDRRNFVKGATKDFKGDNALDPLPRILTESELATLRRGTEQRALALRLFLKDYFSGRPDRYSKIIPPETLKRIVLRTEEESWVGRVNPETISFPYGPDIIRDAEGTWRVIEDNPGWIGGPGDLLQARSSLLKRIPEYASSLEITNEPQKFYEDLVKRYRALAEPSGGPLVFYSVPPFPDHEDNRLQKIYSSLGVETVTPHTKKRLVIDEQGGWLEWIGANKKRIRKKVGYLILNAEHGDADPEEMSMKAKSVIKDARKILEWRGLSDENRRRIEALIVPNSKTGEVDTDAIYAELKMQFLDYGRKRKRNGLAGLSSAIASGKLRSNYTPGLDFIGDKEFNIYVEDLIRHYLKEEPILRNIETERFSGTNTQEVLERVFSKPKERVVKAVDGRGGDSVWVGPKLPPEEFGKARAKVEKDPSRFIAQKYTPLSVVDDRIVDIRMISAVDPLGAYVGETPWGRALPLDGDGKVNLSSNGREMAVLVVKDRGRKTRSCQSSYRGIAR